MEEALAGLLARCEGDREFLRVTSTAFKVVQNIQNEPSEEKFRRLRRTAPFCEKPGATCLLEALGFELRGNHYVLDETYVPSLSLKKKEIMTARRKTRSILGWDVPFSMVRFKTALGACRYGEVFGGCLDDEEVVIKTLKPDCGGVAREGFDRELDILPKLEHPNLVRLLAVTLTSDPTCIVLEFVPTPLLEVLNHGELGDREIVSTSLQVASAMACLHSQGILHCDLGARNVRLTADGVAKLCDFGSARKINDPSCTLTSEGVWSLPLRWTAPEIFQQLQLTVHSDLWSYGVYLYEMVTFGSVPYASFSNHQVRSKVAEGYRLLQPHNCPDELYSLMLHCWLPRATERPSFDDVVRKHLGPLKVKVQKGQLLRQNSCASDDNGDGKSSTLMSPRGANPNVHKSKLKEPSYQQVLGKGGGLLRVSTALVSPFLHRVVVVVCGRKMMAGEVVQVAMAKCGKTDLDLKSHRLALVCPDSSDTAARYLDNEERVLAVKSKAPPTAMFVLCVFTPGTAILEIVNSIKQNPAYGTTFDPRTRGYLVTSVPGEGGTGRRGRPGGQRRWCVLDGSSLLCYREEEEEGVKQFESFVDVKGSSVSPLSGKKSSTTVRVGTSDGGQFVFSAPDKQDMLRWIEALDTASRLDPSAMLIHSGDGAVVQTGYLECQEFVLETSSDDPASSPSPPLHRRLGSTPEFTGTYSAVDYGRHWTVLKSSGLIQCFVRGRPETLFSLCDAVKVKVHNPREGGGADSYFIDIFDKASRIVLQAVCASDHFDWVAAVERVLQDRGLQNKLCGDRGNQSGYVTLKRLMMMQERGTLGERGSAMQLYAMPRLLNTLDDVYDPSEGENSEPPPLVMSPSSSAHSARRDAAYENQNPEPLSPRSYVNFVPPPLLPPRPEAPPLPPKGISADLPDGSPEGGKNLSPPENEDEYVMMHPHSLPPTPSTLPSSPLSLPFTPIGAHPGGHLSQPITIPGHRLPGQPPKPLVLTGTSSSSPHTPSPDSALPPSLSSSHHSSNTPSSHRHTSSSSSLSRRQLVSTNGGASPSSSSPNQFQKPVHPDHAHQEQSGDDVMVGVARNAGNLIGQDEDSSQQLLSDGVCYRHASIADDMVQKLPRGWRKGYCDSKVFYLDTETGQTTSSMAEVRKTDQVNGQPGGQWQVVTLEDGQVYYYHEITRQTTWSVQDTFS